MEDCGLWKKKTYVNTVLHMFRTVFTIILVAFLLHYSHLLFSLIINIVIIILEK